MAAVGDLLKDAEMTSRKLNGELVDDDGRPQRTGTIWTVSAHIITAIIGSGVLSLAWAMAQLGWVAGVATLLVFSCITLYTSNLLADCYRSPHPVTGNRNYTYSLAVRSNLGGFMSTVCGIVQYTNLCGPLIGCTITASKSMVAVHKSNCFHQRGHSALAASHCQFYNNSYMIGFGIFEIFLSQIRGFQKMSWLSTVAAIMSFAYSAIGIGLAIATVITGKGKVTTLTGVEVAIEEKTWRVFRALGDIAFAYNYSAVLIEIQDTIKSPPAENKVMKKANAMSMVTTTVIYAMCACFGYAAFGNAAKGNMLTGFGFYEPFWLIDLANIFIAVHIVGVYQIAAQPVFRALETWAASRWPKSNFINAEYPITIGAGGSNNDKDKNKTPDFSFNLLRLTWRTGVVIIATILAMAMPFFNEIFALLGSIGYWPLTVYFPIQMHIAQTGTRRWTTKWIFLQLLNGTCLLVALAAACGSLQGIGKSLGEYKPFRFKE